MDLIDRYLSAVSFLLPKDQREDITAELRDALMTRREEKEAEVGRPLTRDEDAALLRAFGHPLDVAARFGRGGRSWGFQSYRNLGRIFWRCITAAMMVSTPTELTAPLHIVSNAVPMAKPGSPWRIATATTAVTSAETATMAKRTFRAKA